MLESLADALIAQERSAEAVELLSRSIDLMLNRSTRGFDDLCRISSQLIELSEAQETVGEPDSAAESASRAVSYAREAVGDQDSDETRESLVAALRQMGLVLSGAERYQEAASCFEEALAQGRDLPDDPSQRGNLHYLSGLLQVIAAEPALAVPHFEAALTVCQNTLAEDPTDPVAQGEVVAVLEHLLVAYEACGRIDDAEMVSLRLETLTFG